MKTGNPFGIPPWRKRDEALGPLIIFVLVSLCVLVSVLLVCA